MAYGFVSSSSQYISATAPATAAPLTVSCWGFNSSASGDANRVLLVLTADSTAQRMLLYLATTTPSWFVNDSGGFSQIQSASTVSANTWFHVSAVESASNSRALFLNGTKSTTGQNPQLTRVPSGIASVLIGADRLNNGIANRHTGRVADVGIWNVALTDDEVASLSKGVACRLIRPQSLVFYAPLIRDLVDICGGRTLTNNNTATVEVHPRVYA